MKWVDWLKVSKSKLYPRFTRLTSCNLRMMGDSTSTEQKTTHYSWERVIKDPGLTDNMYGLKESVCSNTTNLRTHKCLPARILQFLRVVIQAYVLPRWKTLLAEKKSKILTLRIPYWNDLARWYLNNDHKKEALSVCNCSFVQNFQTVFLLCYF